MLFSNQRFKNNPALKPLKSDRFCHQTMLKEKVYGQDLLHLLTKSACQRTARAALPHAIIQIHTS
jgi:hypothetical protein